MSLLDSGLIAAAVGTAACALGNLRAAASALRAPRLVDQPAEMPAGPDGAPRPWPALTVIAPACNEAHTLEAATRSLLRADYPDLEIILVNDRSTDGTGAVIDRLAAADPRIRPLHIDALPPDWLGKVHALHRATEIARGELVLYTDADVVFAPDVFRRAVAWMERERLDHLTLMPKMHARSNALAGVSAAFATGFLLGIDINAIGRPGSRAYGGVGAFGMVRKSTLARSPGWPWLRLEIADDAGLAMLIVREAGGRSRLGTGAQLIELEWYESLGALVRGLEKNLFSIIGRYSAPRALGAMLGVILIGLSGWISLGFGLALDGPYRPWLLGLPAFAWATQALLAYAFKRSIAHPPAATLIAPFMLFVLQYALAKSTIATLRRGGVEWRGTVYPLERLRAGRRIDL